MTFEIIITDGHWTINGKKFSELTLMERETLNRFFQELKYNNNGNI